MDLDNLNPQMYDRWVSRKRSMSDAVKDRTYSSLPKRNRIPAALKDFPDATWIELKFLTNLSKGTIKSWFSANEICEHVVPSDVDERLMRALFLYGVSSRDLSELSRYALWRRMRKPGPLTPALDDVLSYINCLMEGCSASGS